MNPRRTSRTIAMLLLGFMVSPVFAQTAGRLSFQALIKDNMGNPINGTVDLEFRIYDAETLGNVVDMDGDGVVEDPGDDVTSVLGLSVTDGIVSTKFGPVHPAAFDGTERWLELSVDDGGGFEALSRVEMVTAPAASEQVNIPGSGTAAIYVDGSGNVGIGTTEPSARLDVVGEGTVGGTGVITSSGTTVTGIGTDFTTELHVGYFIIVGSQEKVVLQITSDTELITDSPFNPAANKSVYTLRQAIARFTDGQGDEVLVINAVGNMGIGATTPLEKLHVGGNAKVDGTVSANAFSSNSVLQLQTAGTTRISVDDGTGNVGIGTMSPVARLDVDGDIAVSGTVDAVDISAHAGDANAHHTPPTALPPIGPADGDLDGTYPNPSVIDDSHLHGDATVSDSLSINNGRLFAPAGAGNVGIGTTSPAKMLQVGTRTGPDNKGVIRIAHKTGATNNEWDIGTGSTAAGGTTDNFYVMDSSNTNTARLMIQSASGNVGIGTTAPGAKLDVDGDLALQNGVAVDEFSSDGTLADNSDSAVPTEKAVRTYVDGIVLGVPVGTVTAWLKSFPNTPALPAGWVECNGQVLDDPGSVFNGQTILDLNGSSGTQRFLRGSTSSGSIGGSETHLHTVPTVATATGAGSADYVLDASFAGKKNTSSTSTLPSYYEVVWIIKVK